MKLSPESITALEVAAEHSTAMFVYYANERAKWQGVLDNPQNWRRPGPDPDGQRVRLQTRRAIEHRHTCKYREQHNAIMRDLALVP